MKKQEKNIGYLRYSGETIKDGLFDARKAGNALIGFDEIVRHFVAQNPDFEEKDFHLLVKTSEGSWKILLITVAFASATAYGVKTAEVAAEKGVAHTGLVKDVKSALSHAINVIKVKKDEAQQNKLTLLDVGPQDLFTKNAEIVDKDINMEIGVYGEDGAIIEQEFITDKDKHIFIPKIKKDEDLEIFSDLIDGDDVVLKGEIVHVSEVKNLIKFRYKNTLGKNIYIDCIPMQNENLAKFKFDIISEENNNIFQKIKIKGKVERKDMTKTPRIRIISIYPLNVQGDLVV